MWILKKEVAVLFFLICWLGVEAQSGFRFDSNKNKTVIPFQLINNLIFIPINVNGVELTFLLDTGVEETILFSLEEKDEISFENIKKANFTGLGSENPVEGLKASGNILAFKNLTDRNHDIYIIIDQDFNFSAQVGIPVNGILGFNFFKNNLIEINYETKKITVYRENKKNKKRIEKRFTAFPITIESRKPYILANVTHEAEILPVKLLIDSGNSDAIWLFKDELPHFKLPVKNFEDYLGRGLSGEIRGKRARINGFNFSGYDFQSIMAAFPDSISMKSSKLVSERKGSVGGEILKRFTIIFDYKNNRIFVNANDDFALPFHYNMSGIEVAQTGMQWIKETLEMNNVPSSVAFTGELERITNEFKYKFNLKPVYTITSVREGSPAAECGLKKDDILVSVNKVNAYRYTLQQISLLLKSQEGKTITMKIDRDGQILDFKFVLKSIL